MEEMKEYNLTLLGSGYKKKTHNLDKLQSDPIANHFAHTLLLCSSLIKLTDSEKGTSYMELHKLFNPYSLYAEDAIRYSVNSITTNVIQRYSTYLAE